MLFSPWLQGAQGGGRTDDVTVCDITRARLHQREAEPPEGCGIFFVGVFWMSQPSTIFYDSL